MCTSNISKAPAHKRQRKCKTTMILLGMACSALKSLYIIGRQYFDMLINYIFGLYWDNTRTIIPDLTKNHNMLAASASTLARNIREGKLKSEDLVKACIERITLVNPILNAMTDERFSAAVEEAREVDRKIQAGISADDIRNMPYLGVPFTSKESHAVHGMLHTYGLTSRRHVRAQEDAECVRLLRAAGAIPVAVTNVPEINKWQETNNMLFGLTCNPYHTGRTPGGSSGGEAALSAALASPISLCSDIGGSTRMPAFYCGLFGHNPTAGTTSLKGSLSRTGKEETMAAIGFVSKRVEDLAPLTKIVAGEKAHLLKLDRAVDVKNIKIYYVETAKDLRISSIRPDLRAAMKKALGKLSSQASATEPYYHEGLSHMYSLWRYWMTREAEDFSAMLADNKGRVNGLIELAKKPLNLSQYTLAAIFKLLDDQVLPAVNKVWAETLTDQLKEDLFSKLGEDGVLVVPSAPLAAPYHYSCFLRPFNFAYWGICNVLRCPATQIPLGLNCEGVPLGVQVVSAPYNDALCLAVATYLEQELGGYVPPCNIIQ